MGCRGGDAVSPCDSCKKSKAVPPTLRKKLKVFSLQELERATNNFSTKNLVGKGSHACVYKAVLSNGQVVAVKRPTLGRRNMQDLTSFDTELEVLSELRHPHLVNLIGVCNESSEKLLVVEFMGNGTLFDLLHSSTEPLSWSLRVHMALQAAKALHVLHSASPPVIHRDVKSSNILVDKSWNAKLGDLGLALRHTRESEEGQRTPPAGTMGYIDPQYETPSQLSTKSDVFSFGILLLEIMSGRNAIDVRFNPSSIVDWAVPLIRQGKSIELCDPAVKPPQDIVAVKQLAAIAARSVRLSRDRRPRMVEIVEGLRRISRKLPPPRYGGKSSRSNTASKPVSTGENSEDFSDGGLSCKSESLSILDEGSVLGDDNSPSQMSVRVMDSYVNGEEQPTTNASPAAEAVLATRKSERLSLDDYDSSGYLETVKMELARNPPLNSPDRSVHNNANWNSRRCSESPVFGSKAAVNPVDVRPSVSASAVSPQQSYSRLRAVDNEVLQVSILSPRNSNFKNVEQNSSNKVSLGSSSQPLDSSLRGLPTSETNVVSKGQELAGAPNSMIGNGISTLVCTNPGTAIGDVDGKPCLNAGSSLQSTVLYSREYPPKWNTNTSARALYTNSESQFEKVDRPIAV